MYENHGKQSLFVLFTLHKQPEASVDILGSYYSDQLWLIEAIVRSMPITHKLYVKEHSNAIGDRSINFYKKVKNLPNTVLVDPFVDTFDLIKKADLILTISGTVAYESAIIGTPSIVFADMFFNVLPKVYRCNNIENLYYLIRKAIKKKYEPLSNEEKEETVKFLAYVIANSFEGVISDPQSDPYCITKENINNLSVGFSHLLGV